MARIIAFKLAVRGCQSPPGYGQFSSSGRPALCQPSGTQRVPDHRAVAHCLTARFAAFQDIQQSVMQ